MTTDILYLVSRLRSSGPTNQLYYILKHLDDEFNATVLTLSPEPEDTELPRFRELGVDYETLGLSRWEGLLYGPRRLRRFVNEYDPAIVQTQGIRADTLSALFLSEYPRITTVRNYPYDDYPAKFGTIQGKAMAAEHIRMYRRIDYPVACSETIADRMRPHGIDAIPIQNGVDTEQFSPVDKTEKARLRKEFDIPGAATVFISVGALIPRKNPLDVIKEFQAADVEDSMLLILGDGPLREECEILAANDDRITIEGWVNNVRDYLGASDYFVSASSSEGLPNTVMEALAAGLPVLLSDIQPHQEILQYNSDVGILFDIEEANTLQNKIENLWDKEYDSPSSKARQMITQELAAETMSTKYQSLYTNVRSNE